MIPPAKEPKIITSGQFLTPPCRPDWCTEMAHPIIFEKFFCASLAVTEFTQTLINKAIVFQKLGLVDKINELYSFINRVNHTVLYLSLLFAQVYLNKEDYPNYISETELKCIRDNFLCQGFDIECVYECFEIGNYKRNCICKT